MDKPVIAKNISRRGLIKVLTALAGGAALYRFAGGMGSPLASSNEPLSDSKVYLPFVSKPLPSLKGKVIRVHAPNATSWSGQSRYWEHVNQSVVNEMVNRGIIELTGAVTLEDAWRSLLPGYQPGQKIAIKVNFNNCWNCGNSSPVIDALIHPVNAVVGGLDQIGVLREDIWVYDAVRALPDRFVNTGLPGIQFFDKYCNHLAGFSEYPDSYIQFNPPAGMNMPAEKISDVVREVAYLINIPIMKGGHPLAGVTLGFKNHFGTIHNCAALHDYVNVVQKPTGYNRDYNPMIDFFRNAHIGGKTILTIGDALFAAKDFNDPPETWSTFGDRLPNSLFFAVDPVAIDCVMHDLIAAELGDHLSAAANRYLVLAGAAGLGVYESRNPWSEAYTQINYVNLVV